MIDEKIEELMWQQIDGEISADDRTKLEMRLREDVEALEYYRELVGISEAIGKGHEIDVPPSLRPRIDAAIDWDRYSRRSIRAASGWLQHLFPSTGWDLRVVPVAVVAFIVGMVAYHMAGTGPAPRGDVSRFLGTMAPLGDTTPQVQIDLDAVQGTVGFHADGDVTVSEIALTSAREVEVQMLYEGESLEFGALGGDGSPLQGIMLNADGLVVKNVGANKYYFVFRSDSRSGPVRVRVLDGTGLLLEREWIPGPGSR